MPSPAGDCIQSEKAELLPRFSARALPPCDLIISGGGGKRHRDRLPGIGEFDLDLHIRAGLKDSKNMLIEAFYILFFYFTGEFISYFIDGFIPGLSLIHIYSALLYR